MDERFRLVFRGEVLEGQHRAVVKRRLGEALTLDEPQLEALFSGRVVVLNRDADARTAAHYQALFRKAGGRLRVLPVEAPPGDPASEQHVDAQQSSAPNAVNAPQFSLQAEYVPPPRTERVQIEAPAFDVAAPGARLAEPRVEREVRVPEADFELAEVGADLLPERAPPTVADLGPLDFEVAAPGTPLGEASRSEPPAAPDTSHIRLAEP